MEGDNLRIPAVCKFIKYNPCCSSLSNPWKISRMHAEVRAQQKLRAAEVRSMLLLLLVLHLVLHLVLLLLVLLLLAPTPQLLPRRGARGAWRRRAARRAR